MEKIIVNSSYCDSSKKLGKYLYKMISSNDIYNRPIVFLCIGSDRCTGDSLGPLVGDKIKYLEDKKNIFVYGCLKETVTAINLADTLNIINSNHINPYIIAIDASLGDENDIGNIIIKNQALSPGKALNKQLPSAGNLSIVGIVNMSSMLQFSTLQSTRLFTVMTIANTIANSISYCLNII